MISASKIFGLYVGFSILLVDKASPLMTSPLDYAAMSVFIALLGYLILKPQKG